MKTALLLATTFLCTQGALASGTTVGNGGDEIRFKFEEARIAAAQTLRDLKDCSFDRNVASDVKTWISNYAAQLKDDVMKSPHQWTSETKTTCARTELSSHAEIVLSYPRCEQNISLRDASLLLIHESVHHFGIFDESFADKVAIAIMDAVPGAVCSKNLLPEDTKWVIRDRIKQLLPPNLNGDSKYFGTYKDSGNDCSLLFQTGPAENADPNHKTIESFIISVLDGRFAGSGTGLSITVLTNIDGSPYLPGFVTHYSDNENILSMDYVEKYLNQKWTANSLRIDYSNSETIEVTVSNKNNPLRPNSRTCVISR